MLGKRTLAFDLIPAVVQRCPLTSSRAATGRSAARGAAKAWLVWTRAQDRARSGRNPEACRVGAQPLVSEHPAWRMETETSRQLVATDEVRLAEFDVLRREIAQRSSFQHGLMVLNLTAIGAVVGLVFGRNVDGTLLLVLPVLSSALGLLWFSNHVAITRIATYIGTELWIWTPSWELWLTDAKYSPKQARWSHRTLWPTVQLIFCGPPIAALAIGLPLHDSSCATWALWFAGLALTVYLATASSFLRRLPRPTATNLGSGQARQGQ
jgi:hypothetical protein